MWPLDTVLPLLYKHINLITQSVTRPHNVTLITANTNLSRGKRKSPISGIFPRLLLWREQCFHQIFRCYLICMSQYSVKITLKVFSFFIKFIFSDFPNIIYQSVRNICENNVVKRKKNNNFFISFYKNASIYNAFSLWRDTFR